MNALQHVLKFLESKKAELVLEEQINQFEFNFSDRSGEVAYENIPVKDTIEVGNKTFVYSVDHDAIADAGKECVAESYQQVTNFINFLKELHWDDFHFDCSTLITIDRTEKWCDGRRVWGHQLKVIEWDEKSKEYVGKAYYQRGLSEEGLECISFCEEDDFLEVDKQKDKKEYYSKNKENYEKL